MPESKLYGDKVSFSEISYDELGQEATILVNNTGDSSGNIVVMEVSNFKGEKGERGYPGNVVFPDGFVATANGYNLIGLDTYREMREAINSTEGIVIDSTYFVTRGDIFRPNVNKEDIVAGGDLRLMPVGAIIMWSGSITNIPNGWVLCNGSNGTPDLRNKFVVGAGGSYSVGSQGGADSVTLTSGQSGVFPHNHWTDEVTHHHALFGSDANDYDSNLTGIYGTEGFRGIVGEGWGIWGPGDDPEKRQYISSEAHDHYVTDCDAEPAYEAHENRPPYYALCYIKFVGYN